MKTRLDHIFVDPEFNCRGEFTQQSIQELAKLLEAQGLINPVSIMPNPKPCAPPFMLIAGFRRTAAARYLGWEFIEAILMEDMTDREARKVNLQENLGRRDLLPSQEMRGIIASFGDNPNVEEVAKELGKSKKWVQDRLRIREMDPRIVKSVDDGLLGALDLQYLSTALPGERWNMARMLMEKKAEGISSKSVARELRLRKKPRGLREIREAKELLMDYGRTPSWTEVMDWCAGEVPSEKFFDLPLDKLKEYGILE